MAYDMGGIFGNAGNPPQHPGQQQQGQQHNSNMWPGLQQAQAYRPGPMSGLMGAGPFPNGGMPPPPHPLMAIPPMPSMPPMQQMVEPPKAESIQGFGQLTWLSSKAGLISCIDINGMNMGMIKDKEKLTISFQIKDFCDQMLSDLTSVLRVGFTLSFQASLNETNVYTATLVQPLYGAEAEQVFLNSNEVDLEKACPTPPNSKDAYSPSIEERAIPALLSIFQRHGLNTIQLSSLHSQMSNCGDEELFRYVGTSSLKRRQFVERRTHIFRLTPDDAIALQRPAIYLCVLRLASYLLRRGGATAIQSLYEYYLSAEMNQCIEVSSGEGRQDFLNLITSHPWIFALFPNRTYVSVRRNLPHYDYPGFIKKFFPDLDSPQSGRQPQNGYGQPQQQRPPMARSMSHQPLVAALSANRANGGGMGQQQQQQQSHRPQSLWDNQPSMTPMPTSMQSMSLHSPADYQFSSLFNWMDSTSSARGDSSRGGGSTLPTPSGGVIGSAPGSHLSSNGVKMVNAAIQTDQYRECSCSCTCGGRTGYSRASVGSASPPSMDSISPGSLGGHLSPLSNGFLGLSNERNEAPATGYYDMFGTDILTAGARLGSLRI